MDTSVKNISIHVLLFVFIGSLLFVNVSTLFLAVNKITGLLIFVHWLAFSRKLYFPKHIKVYGFFILFSALSGFIVAKDFSLVAEDLKTMAQLWGLMIITYASYDGKTNLAGISILLLSLALFAHQGSILGLSFEGDASGFSDRNTGATQNANVLGLLTMLGLLGTLQIVDASTKPFLRFFKRYWFVLFIICALILLPTGSRKSFLSLTVLFAYRLLNDRQGRGTLPLIFTVILFVSVFLSNQILDYFGDSVMGQRILDESTLEHGVEVRQGLYELGLEIFFQSPLIGIGLNNFRLLSDTGHVSHSYFIEVLSGTGVLGFLLILSIYLHLIKQSRLVIRNGFTLEGRFVQQFMVVMTVMFFGFSYHDSIRHWILVTLLFSVLDYLSRFIRV